MNKLINPQNPCPASISGGGGATPNSNSKGFDRSLNLKNIFDFTKPEKAAFSLAETMIMLVIVSIIMAVSAPLITRKAAADAKRLILTGHDGGQDVVVVPANAQTFGIGINNPINSENGNRIKLHVAGASILNGAVRIGDGNNLIINNDGHGIFQINGTDEEDEDVTNTFQFNTTNGTTNITNLPQYDEDHTRTLTAGTRYSASNDGFIKLNDGGEIYIYYTIDRGWGINAFTQTNTVDPDYTSDISGVGQGTGLKIGYIGDDDEGVPKYNFIIPIKQGTKFVCRNTDCLFIDAQSRINE